MQVQYKPVHAHGAWPLRVGKMLEKIQSQDSQSNIQTQQLCRNVLANILSQVSRRCRKQTLLWENAWYGDHTKTSDGLVKKWFSQGQKKLNPNLFDRCVVSGRGHLLQDSSTASRRVTMKRTAKPPMHDTPSFISTRFARDQFRQTVDRSRHSHAHYDSALFHSQRLSTRGF